MQSKKNSSKTNHNFLVSVENYVKAIWEIENITKKNNVRSTDIAHHLGVKLPSVSNMLQKLKREGLIKKSQTPISLSPKGEHLLSDLLKRHQLLEMFLEKTLGLNVEESHLEAELLEHAISPKLLEKINKFLGSPEQDSQGFKIPANH